MNKEEMISKIQEIGLIEDDAQRRSALADLQEGIESAYDSLESVTSERDNLKNDNEDLRKANMNLFLKVGQKDQPDNPGGVEDPPERRKFEDLFNEKGGIK